MAGKPGAITTSIVVITQIKAMFESGVYANDKNLHVACKQIFVNCPTLRAIRRWRIEGKWDKRRSQKKLEESQKRSYDDLFAAHGMGDEQAVLEVISGIRLADKVMEELTAKIAAAGKNPDEDTVKYIQGLAKELGTNFNIKESFLIQRHKLVGAGAYGTMRIKNDNPLDNLKNMPQEEREGLLKDIAEAYATQR